MSVVVNASSDRHRRSSGTMPATTSDFTACGWFYFGGDTNSYATLFCINDSTGTPNDGWYLQTQGDGTTLAIWDADGGIWYSTDIGAMTVGNWYHVAIRKNGTNLRGSMRARTTLTYTTAACAGAPADTFTAANLEFGNDAYPDPVNGNFANWKIYQADLTDAELLQESLRFVPSRWANLWAWYPMLNTGGQDYGPNGYHLNVATGLTVGDNPPIVWGGSSIIVMQPAGGTTHNPTATIAGASSLTAVGANALPFTAAVGGASSLTGIGTNGIPLTASATGTSSLTAVGIAGHSPVAGIIGTSSLTSAGANVLPFSATLGGASSLTATGVNALPFTAGIAGASSLTAVGQITGLVDFTASIAGTSSLTGAGVNAFSMSAGMVGMSNVTTAGYNVLPFTAGILGASALTADGFLAWLVGSGILGTSSFEAAGVNDIGLNASILGASSIVGVGYNGYEAAASLSGSSSLTVVGFIGELASIALEKDLAVAMVYDTRLGLPYVLVRSMELWQDIGNQEKMD